MTDSDLLYGVLVEPAHVWLSDDLDTHEGKQRRPAVYLRRQEAQDRADNMRKVFGYTDCAYRVVALREVTE